MSRGSFPRGSLRDSGRAKGPYRIYKLILPKRFAFVKDIKMPNTYILKSLIKDNWHYVGSCRDINKRLGQHNKGSVKSTKSKRPLKLIHLEFYDTVSAAKKREYFLKSPKGYLEKRRIVKLYNTNIDEPR